LHPPARARHVAPVADGRRSRDRPGRPRRLGLHGLSAGDREAREPAHPPPRGGGPGGGGAAHRLTHFRLEQVAEGAWAAIADSDLAAGNAGIVDLGGEMLVFDTSWTPEAARELAGLGPVRWVANSHWHGDHVRGNQV